MIEITYQYKNSNRTLKYEDKNDFLISQMACSLDIPSFYQVKKIVVNGKEIESLKGSSQDNLYEYFNQK